MNKRFSFPLLLLLALGCAPTETGNPPAYLDPDAIHFVPSPVVEDDPILDGEPGAVIGDAVVLLNLEDPTEFSTVPVAGDGSFVELSAPVAVGERFRVWARAGVSVSSPNDYRAAATEALDLSALETSCLSLTPAIIDSGATSVVDNACADAVTLAPTVRGSTVDGDLMMEVVAAGERRELDLGALVPVGDYAVVELVASGAATESRFVVVRAP